MTLETTSKETPREFELRCAAAIAAGEDYIEADDTVIRNFIKGGLKSDEYFIYQNVKVFLPGGYDRWEKKESTPLDKRYDGWDKVKK